MDACWVLGAVLGASSASHAIVSSSSAPISLGSCLPVSEHLFLPLRPRPSPSPRAAVAVAMGTGDD